MSGVKNKFAIIVAGGKGLRMGSEIPKQFLLLEGLPILMHTINSFKAADPNINVILVLPLEHFGYWKSLVETYNFEHHHVLVEGGDTRFQSVKNGLFAIDGDGLVAIHDGVRPFVTTEIIENSYEMAEAKGSAIAAVASKDSLRVRQGTNTKSVKRSDYFLVQTPQTFKLNTLRNAFNVEESDSFTDDASVFEYAGNQVNLIDGSYKNIKITTEEDLVIASAMISRP